MQLSQKNKKKQSLYVIQQKKPQSKKPSIQKIKIIPVAKFSRQTSSKITNPTPPIKSQLIVPQLNLIKINSPKVESPQQKILNKQTPTKKYLNRVQTKQTKDQLTSYRHSDQQIFQQQKIKQQLKITPTISNKQLYSPIQTLLKSNKSRIQSDSLNTQADKQQLLILQIKQLKRENTFLKKKIKDMKKQLNGGYLPEQYERKSPSTKQKKGHKQLNIESMHLSINLFFQQIKNLLNSVTQLFKIQFTQSQIQLFQSQHSDFNIDQINEEICPLKKHQILKKFFLKKKLDKLSYEQNQKKYQLLLSIFTQYYTYKQESQKKVIQTIDNMIMYTNDLNKWLISKAYAKKIKTQVQSQKSTQRQFNPISPPKFDSLRVPTNPINHVTKNRKPTLSPNPHIKSNQKL